jgi:stage II sporulation protein D
MASGLEHMMKAFLTALIIVLLTASFAFSGNIRVLILDGEFGNIPEQGEDLDKLDRIKGQLLVSHLRYTGDIEVWKGRKGLYLINELPIEDYIKNVVKAEVAEDWDMEALKAQAVITRTYAVYNMMKNGGGKFDLTSSVLHQVYRGDTKDTRVSYAVIKTEGEILTYEGKPIEALYHSTSGGMTENPEDVFGFERPYLKAVKTDCDISPYSIWARRIPLGEMGEALKTNELKDIKIKSYTSTGRVKELEIISDSENITITGNEFRKMLGWKRLPSTNFTLSIEEGDAVFEGRGYGHGVGLCQWSSLQMAKDGKTYREILSYFYPGTSIELYEDKRL